MNQLYLVRHGHAQGGPSGMDRDFTLSDVGRRQAHDLGAYLKDKSVNPIRIYCSVLTRARQTAEILHPYLGGPIYERQDLIEHGAHAYIQDCSLQEAVRRHPDWLKSDGSPRCCQGPTDGLNWEFSVGGESMRMLHCRAREVWESLIANYHHGSGSFVLVSHGCFLAAFLSEALQLPLRPVWNFAFENCGFFRLDIHEVNNRIWPVLAASEMTNVNSEDGKCHLSRR